ncbi:MAG: RNA-binding S4 domain-containing protein [Verrucomicrobiales bacterium]
MLNSVVEVRIDKWLWAARVYKTRALATEACRGGAIKIEDQAVKPSRSVKIGDIISARVGVMTRTLKVLTLADKRVGPKLVDQLAEDQTPASEYLKEIQARQAPVVRPRGTGRPTKKERRQFEEFKETLGQS